MRSIASFLASQFIVENNLPGLVIRAASPTPGELGPVILVIDPNENLSGAILEGSTTKPSTFWTLRSLAVEISAG